VKVFGIIAVVLVLLFVILHLTGRGPWPHTALQRDRTRRAATTMTLGLRKFALTAHVTFSVGWLGAVAGFLALAIAALTSQNAQTVRGTYLAMELMGCTSSCPSA